MAGRTEYYIQHPNGITTITALKGGKIPTFATWGYIDATGWERLGWSYQATLEDAKRKALPDMKKYGMKVTATPILGTR